MSRGGLIIAMMAGFYLYFLLPATAALLLELYHLTGIETLYVGYSLVKVAGYYFTNWPYRELVCVLVIGFLVIINMGLRALRNR